MKIGSVNLHYLGLLIYGVSLGVIGVAHAAPELVSSSYIVPTWTANGGSDLGGVSSNGRWVAFSTVANDVLSTITDSNSTWDVYVHDRQSNSKFLVSRRAVDSATANNQSLFEGMSADGRYVMFNSLATNVVAGQTGSAGHNVYLWDRLTGLSKLITGALGSPTAVSGNQSNGKAMSADGRFLTFVSAAPNIIAGVTDGNSNYDVFLHDQVTGATTLVSRAFVSPTIAANGRAFPLDLSSDGRFVLYMSEATNILSSIADNNFAFDLFLYDSLTGSTTLVSKSTNGFGTANGESGTVFSGPLFSGNNEFLVFESRATDLVEGVSDDNNQMDVFSYDIQSGSIAQISKASSSPIAGNGASHSPVVSSIGRLIVFNSYATNLVPNGIDTNGLQDVFLIDLASGDINLVSHVTGSEITAGNGDSSNGLISANGSKIYFDSSATNIVSGVVDTGAFRDLFAYDVNSRSITLGVGAFGNLGTPPNGNSALKRSSLSMSYDGKILGINTGATNIIGGVQDINNGADVYALNFSPILFAAGFE